MDKKSTAANKKLTNVDKIKPKESIKYLKVLIDPKCLEAPHGTNIITKLCELKIKYEIRKQTVPGTILWERSVQQQQFISSDADDEMVHLTKKVNTENFILLFMTGENVIASIKSRSFIQKIEEIQTLHTNKCITIIIFGLQSYCKKNPKLVSRIDMEMDLTELQILFKCNHRLIELADEVAITVAQFTKAIAEEPFKKQELCQYENFNFFIKNDSKDCVQVEDQIGLTNLWQQHLMKLPSVTLEKAQSLLEEYPMPLNLVQAFQSQDDGSQMLSDIPVRRNAGMSKGRERIGPELSKKMHTFYTTKDPNVIIS